MLHKKFNLMLKKYKDERDHMIVFIRKWGTSRENTWSGTPNGLYNSLSKICGKSALKDIAISYNALESFLVKVLHGAYRVLSIDGCEVIEEWLESVKMQKQTINLPHVPMLVFTDYLTNKVGDTYLFIDCSVDYAYRCYLESPDYAKYVPLSRKKKYSLIRKRYKKAQTFYNNCKGIFTMGEWLAKDLIDHSNIPRTKVHCVGGGCNIPTEEIDSSRKTGNKFLFVGKDFERKGGPLVVEAFLKLNQKHKNKYELYIAGPAKWPFASEIPEHITFLGLKSTEELVEYYNLCDVFVMPSLFEAYGIVFAEALIYGLPCIGRDIFSMKDFIQEGHNGYLLKNNNVNELVILMELLIEDKIIKQNVQNDRMKYINKYSWDGVAKKMLEVISRDGYRA